MVNDFLCFDTESAQGRVKGRYVEELIEISIMNAASQEVYYHRFKPSGLSQWDTSIHHITPAMVAGQPSVADQRGILQRIFDSARYIVGFSLIDDFKAIANAGIICLENKRRVELRHLYWYCVGRHNGVQFYSGPGLSHCAKELGVTVVEDAVHTANGDTKVTLNLFFALMKMFHGSEGLAGEAPAPGTPEFTAEVDLALKRISEAKIEYDRAMAKGYIHIVKHPDGGYRFIPTVSDIDQYDGACLSVAVNARRKALFELEKEYSRRRILNTKNFALTIDDIHKIKLYNNEFDNQEQIYQRLLGLLRNAVTAR